MIGAWGPVHFENVACGVLQVVGCCLCFPTLNSKPENLDGISCLVFWSSGGFRGIKVYTRIYGCRQGSVSICGGISGHMGANRGNYMW